MLNGSVEGRCHARNFNAIIPQHQLLGGNNSMRNIEMVKASRKMRKAGRRGTRRVVKRGGSRKMTRRSRSRSRGGCWSGGSHAGIDDMSMEAASKLSLAQGGDYQTIHSKQHGGMAPVGYTGVLDDSLRASARIAVLDQSVGAIQGMSDQSGGGRRKKAKKTMKAKKSKKAKKTMKAKKSKNAKKIAHKFIMAMLKNLRKKQRGGSTHALTQAQDYSAPGMLLSPAAEARALAGMNPEWKLATDPSAFAPKM